MGFLRPQDEAVVRKELEAIVAPVKVVVFASELGPETNAQTVALMKEVAALSEKITLEVLNPFIDRERAEAYGLDDLTPVIVVEGERDYGIRFIGIPAGYEFRNFLDSLLLASTGDPALSEATTASLAALAEDVTIKVFSTPT
jgi:alkyl hydroperoxide reductase subunit AhpF